MSRQTELAQLRHWIECFIAENPTDWKAQLGKVFQASSNEQLSQFGTDLYLQDLETFNRRSAETFERVKYEAGGGPDGFAREFISRNGLPKPSYR